MESRFRWPALFGVGMILAIFGGARAAKPFRPVETGVMRGGQAPARLQVDVRGVKSLYLVATIGGDTYSSDQAIWAEPVLIDKAGKATPLTTLKPVSASVGWGRLVIDADRTGRKGLRIGKQSFARGFWAHAPSMLGFRLDGKYVRFEASVGIDVAAGTNGSVTFKVLDKPVKLPGARRPPPPPAPATPDAKAMRRAITDLARSFGERYPRGGEFLERLDAIEAALSGSAAATPQQKADLLALQREALLANPLLDFERLLLRRTNKLGLPRNWQSNTDIAKTGYNNDIAVLSPVRPDGKLTTLFRPGGGEFVGDVDLHFDAGKMLFSMPGAKKRWQIFEILADGTGLRQVTPGAESDVDNYDACYLPDGRIMFTSTAGMVSVPCVRGSAHVSTLFRMDADGGSIRQLGFDQDHNWCPAVLNNGQVLYLRWEYSGLPHSNSRILFRMNPDGTGQMEYYGSNSYWPNGVFYARPIPGHPTEVVGVISGHHCPGRVGELILFDPAKGRHESDGVVQRIPGYGKKVTPVISDNLINRSWPKFLHPYPLGEAATGLGAGKYFLVSCQLTSRSPWGVYLVDVFDNMVPVKIEPGFALLEPIPFRKTPTPPVLPDKVDLKRKDALVYLVDVYAGGGLAGVPRGEVKKLRLFTYTYSYRGTGGLLGGIGWDGPWDIKRVLGTVPVEADGSALFRVPANTPISVQPLDTQGKALQLMRSWLTAMPGETLSCVGCHEKQNDAPPSQRTLAAAKAPAEITPWRGRVRGFSFKREVQPVLDRYCVGCHNGKARPGGEAIADLRGDTILKGWKSVLPGNTGSGVGGKFSMSYAALHRYVRRPGIESGMHMLRPMDFHADSAELVQMLAKGHHNVRLDAEAWDRIVTWIDLNAPYHGEWSAIRGPGMKALERRRAELRKLYGHVDENHEDVPAMPTGKITPILPPPLTRPPAGEVTAEGWPFSAAEAKRRQAALGSAERTIDLGGGVTMRMALIPPGEYVMGNRRRHPDESPPGRVRIAEPFWMGTLEVTNAQFARFDPTHDSGTEVRHGYQFGVPDYPLNTPAQPVVRVSFQRAVEFCRWLSRRTGRTFALPTEAQWEYACRAGSAAAFSYGDADTDFAKHANLGDARLRDYATQPYQINTPMKNATIHDDWVPKDARFNDGAFLSVAGGKYQPNAWGLHDMHGNVAEWTRSVYRPYPYSAADGRNDPDAAGRRVVRGGSWYDRPKRCRSAFRLSYRPYQRVFNVGFRVVCSATAPPTEAAKIRRK